MIVGKESYLLRFLTLVLVSESINILTHYIFIKYLHSTDYFKERAIVADESKLNLTALLFLDPSITSPIP